MGLGVQVGFLADQLLHDEEGAAWFRARLAKLDGVLERNGLPGHEEPEHLPKLRFRGCHAFPYSFLHYLRRAAAYHRRGQPLPDGDLTRAHEQMIDRVSEDFDQHLLCHSDAEGFYVPVDFPEPVFDDDVPGVMLGSSQALLRELTAVAAALGITWQDGGPTAEAVDQMAGLVDEGPHYREKIVWLALWELAQASVQHRTLLVFT